MFTSPSLIYDKLVKLGLQPQQLHYIDRGVMTDKYSFLHQGEYYIARCFQRDRTWLAAIEFKYLQLFEQKGIKAPTPYVFSKKDIPLLVYERLEGETLADIFGSLDNAKKKSLCDEIASNYSKISDIVNHGYGSMSGFGVFSDLSWQQFLLNAIDNAETYCRSNNLSIKHHIFERLTEFTHSLNDIEPRLTWSDFSCDNIIVRSDGTLSGFIDFEGLLSGDPALGTGYLKAHDSESEFYNMIQKAFGQEHDTRLIDFYAAIRWCRLLPYQKLPLPNGKERMNLNKYLPYAYKILENF